MVTPCYFVKGRRPVLLVGDLFRFCCLTFGYRCFIPELSAPNMLGVVMGPLDNSFQRKAFPAKINIGTTFANNLVIKMHMEQLPRG